MAFSFKVKTTSGRARRGELTLNHGVVQTPIFMPVGTYGSVKAMAVLRLFSATPSTCGCARGSMSSAHTRDCMTSCSGTNPF